MPLIDAILDALSLWPSSNKRTRRYEKIGCLVGSLASALVGFILAVVAVIAWLHDA